MSLTPKKIAFWGTPELTCVYLDALLEADMKPVVIITNPDRPKGRGHELTPTPAKLWGMKHGVQVLTPEKCDDTLYEELTKLDLDLSIVVAYGALLPERFIQLPRYKTLNVHYSLLPKYRGASPTEAAILAGDTETGCAIQVMAFKLDSGPLIAVESTPIGADETTPELRARLTTIGAKLLVATLPDYLAGRITPVPQDDSLMSKCGKIKKEDAKLELTDDAVKNYSKYRAYIEWPRTYFYVTKNGAQVRIIITAAHFANNTFIIDRVLPEGKKEVTTSDFFRGLMQ